MEGTNHPCRMARQGVSTAREERRDMGVKEWGVESKLWGGFQFFEYLRRGFLAREERRDMGVASKKTVMG